MTAAHADPVDVLVVGAGPAGISAAIAAAPHVRRVLVLDTGIRAGGQVWRHRDPALLPADARQLLSRARAANIVFAHGARVIDAVSPGEVVVDFGGRIERRRARAVVLATGARERFLPFPGWTLPGVVGIGGLQALVKSGLSLRGARVVIAGTGPLLFPVAATASAAGARVLVVAERAPWRQLAAFALSLRSKPGALRDALRYRWSFRHSPLRTGTSIVSAEGDGRIRSATLHDGRAAYTLDCDWLATSSGLVPSTELAQLMGCAVERGSIAVDATQATSVPSVWAAGECTGVKGDAAAIAEGRVAGQMAAGCAPDQSIGVLRRRQRSRQSFARRLEATFCPPIGWRELLLPDTVICRCEDVRLRDIDPRWSSRQAKLWTRIGMGECQGAVCGTACAALFGWQANAVRPPLHAPACGAWAASLDNVNPPGDAPDGSAPASA